MFFAPQLVEVSHFQSAALHQSPMVAYFATLAALTESMAPARGAARASAEAMGFVSRRTLATMDTAARLSRCRSPKDVLDEQTRFWNTAMHQYVEASARMVSAWSQATVLPHAVEHTDAELNADRAASVRSRPHDIILLPDTKQSSIRAQKPASAARDREAA